MAPTTSPRQWDAQAGTPRAIDQHLPLAERSGLTGDHRAQSARAQQRAQAVRDRHQLTGGGGEFQRREGVPTRALSSVPEVACIGSPCCASAVVVLLPPRCAKLAAGRAQLVLNRVCSPRAAAAGPGLYRGTPLIFSCGGVVAGWPAAWSAPVVAWAAPRTGGVWLAGGEPSWMWMVACWNGRM
jgi:hypothetical protein